MMLYLEIRVTFSFTQVAFVILICEQLLFNIFSIVS